jgi:serine/threonine protein kinase
LTPRTGSVPFMAPEVARCDPYDEKADVFGFAILLWEILSFKTAFPGYSRKIFWIASLNERNDILLLERGRH